MHVRRSKHPQSQVVVRGAAQAARDEYTEVWAVFDTDGRDVTELVGAAERDGVHTAPSTPTFESWLILHVADHRAALESGAKAERVLKRLVPGWDKGRTHFKDFAHGLKDARERAARLPAGTDPSTGVHRLLEVILRD